MTASQQARADALADAETLRRIAPVWSWVDLELHSTDALKSIGVGFIELAAHDAKYVARAAFHHVPGLRGDR